MLTTYTLVNRGNRRIVAWEISSRWRFADGTVRRHGTARDRYQRLADPNPADHVLDPGERELVTRAGGPIHKTGLPVVAIEAEVAYVIFDDDTASGDDALIEAVFRRRQFDQQVWRFIERTLIDAIASSGTPDLALQTLVGALDSSDALIRGDLQSQVIRRRVELHVKGSPTIDPSELLKESRARLAAAAAHAIRRH
jgi:hypothetical protein